LSLRAASQDEHKDEIEAVLREFVPQCRRQPGHRDFVAHKSVQRPNEFLLYEHYGTEQDFVDHQATAHFKEPPCRRYCWGAQLRARAGGRAHQRAATPLALYTDRTASPFGEPPDLREPEAGAAARGLCREVRGEGLREDLLDHALPVVGDDDLDEPAGGVGGWFDVPRREWCGTKNSDGSIVD
jgi:quinol monooxygenase YgiN